MYFPSFRRQARRRRRPTQQVELLEPRELLAAVTQLTSAEVTKLLDRASMATSSNDAIIAVVDRGGHILGVRVEQAVLDGIDADTANGGNNNKAIDTVGETKAYVYAIDGAVAKARTAAFFANGTTDTRIVPDVADPTGTPTPSVGPLTSRTVRNISQTTITQREVQSNPSIKDPNSRLLGPGFVAPIGVGQHFPPGVPHTPQVDLFAIEHTNRDSIVHPGTDGVKGLNVLTGLNDDIKLSQRFNINPAFVPAGKTIDAPESFGFVTGRLPNAQARGIATLPGGLPIYRGLLDVVGGIGVFFPGTRDPDGAGPGAIGDATFEQNFPNAQTEYDRTNAPKVLEAEYTALFAIGGAQFGGLSLAIDRIYGGDFPMPFGRIDLVGINLQIIGPAPGVTGVRTIEAIGDKIQPGSVQLATAINSTATTLTVNNGALLPADDGNPATVDFFVRIDNEVLAVRDVAGNTLMVNRAQGGSNANNHAAGKQLVTGSGANQALKVNSSVAVALSAVAPSLVVPDASVFPPVDANPATIDFSIRVDNEEIAVTNISGNTLSILRGQNATAAAAHAIGATIRTVANFTAVKGRVIGEGWLVLPHDSPIAGTPITAAQVRRIIEQGIIVAGNTESRLGLPNDGRRVRAAIRLEVQIPNIATFDANNPAQVNRVRTNPGAAASMVLAVADADGNVLGLYRMHDSTIFSIDVAVAKARNTVYYAGPDLQAIDQVDDDNNGVADVPKGTAFTNRTFRFLVEPRFPQGVDGSRPGDFSILNETVGGVPVFQTNFLATTNPNVATRAVENNGAPARASDFQTVLGYDSFHPGTNFRDPKNPENQNGIVFFPGSTPLYAGGAPGSPLIGGYGISGDGVDQDDVVTFYGAQGFLPPDANVIADEVKVRNTRLPYQKFNRNPFG